VSVRTEPAPTAMSAGSRRPLAAMVLSLALLAVGVALLVVAVRGPEPPGSLSDRVRAVASTLRCPVCQNLSVADSPSGLAGQMRGTIRGDLQAGRTPDQVRARFVASYGEWILLSPPRHGLELAVWILPALLLVGGLAAGALAVRRWTFGARGEAGHASEGREALSPGDRKLLDEALKRQSEEETS
jgi:cytochrome c-type biogenesis protein CcmH